MDQQQFQNLQSKIVMLNAQQLKALQGQIEDKLVKENGALLSGEELDALFGLFNPR